MDGIKGGGGGRVVVGVGEEDMGDGMQCSDHPYRNNAGGICAFCLQEKLGKLVSSSFPLPIRGSSSSSSTPCRSDIGSVGVGVGGSSHGSTSLSLVVRPTGAKFRDENNHFQNNHTRRANIPFLWANRKKIVMASSSDRDIVYKRSKSTTTPGRRHSSNAATDYSEAAFSPRKRGGFWSFLYLSSSKNITGKKTEKVPSLTITTTTAATNGSIVRPKEKCQQLGSSSSNKGHVNLVVVEDDDSANSQVTASARKVSRSRSVGCGSRSFSGDFFERISTGFGDCTLRRVESQREGKPKVAVASNMKERVKCGGIFSGFIINYSSSSSSSSSYWISSSAEDMNGRATAGPLSHGRSTWSWGWTLASPMRAFSKPSSNNGKRDIAGEASSKKATPNFAAVPSLLAVRG